MKRTLPLVSYDSSDDDHDDGDDASQVVNKGLDSPPKKKKRKLPSLPSTFLPSTNPIDDPTLHQGRVRTAPHVEGQFAAYVYVSVKLSSSSTRRRSGSGSGNNRKGGMGEFVKEVVESAKGVVPELVLIGFGNQESEGEGEGELHVSLSRPVYLRAHQREEMRRAVRDMAKSQKSFEASFATFSVLDNDEKTRTFVTLEIGAGHTELAKMTESLVPTLRSIRQKEFYTEPRFHASIAWALLEPPTKTRTEEDEVLVSLSASPSVGREVPVEDRFDRTKVLFGDGGDLSASATTSAPTSTTSSSSSKVTGSVLETFPRIKRLPDRLVEKLKREFGERLVEDREVGRFLVDRVCVRIGKEVSWWRLSG